MSHDTPYAVPLAVAAALSVGLINAFGILRLGVHPILMTLSTMTAVQGVALFVRPIPGGQVPAWWWTSRHQPSSRTKMLVAARTASLRCS